MKDLTVFFIFLILFIANVKASDSAVAEVIKIRGEVTQLAPHSLLPRKVAIGDKFVEDTSIVTGPKSFIKIKFIDNTEVNLGPESKIVIAEMKKNSVGIISLLKGRIRTEVQKESERPLANKFFIKTRTAAMGVRGTDFQTIYNPDIKMTSLLTYRGEVAMAKVDEKTFEQNDKSLGKTIERDDVSKVPEIVNSPVKKNDEISELNRVLGSKSAVLVPPGQNSFSSDALKKTSLPVKISPVQLEALYKNQDFQEKSKENVKIKSQESVDQSRRLSVAAQTSPAEGLYNAKTGDFAPKSGGFIDQNTGLYVAPDSSAKLDPMTGVYVSDKTGNVDADTGQYIAPKGLILDAKKGFIVDGDTDKPELLALRQDLNQTIARDIVIGADSSESELAFNIKEKFIRDRLSFAFNAQRHEIKINENQTNAQYLGLTSKDDLGFSFDWQMATNNRFSPLLGIDYSITDFSKSLSGQLTEDSKKMMNLSFGAQFALNEKINLFSKLGLHQNYFLDQITTGGMNTYNLKRVVLTRFSFGGTAEFLKRNRWSLNTSLEGLFTFRKRINSFVVNEGLGYKVELLPKYKLSEYRYIGIGLKIEEQHQRLAGTMGVNQQDRITQGLELKCIADY